MNYKLMKSWFIVSVFLLILNFILMIIGLFFRYTGGRNISYSLAAILLIVLIVTPIIWVLFKLKEI